MNLRVKALLEAEIEPDELASAVFQRAFEVCGRPDDAGMDWFTDHHGRTYIGSDGHWCISKDPAVAALVDAACVLRGYRLDNYKIDDATLAAAEEEFRADFVARMKRALDEHGVAGAERIAREFVEQHKATLSYRTPYGSALDVIEKQRLEVTRVPF